MSTAPALTRRALEDGRVEDEPSEALRAELDRLEALGLVSLTWSQTFLCVDHGDDEDLLYARDRACPCRLPYGEAHPEDPTRPEDDLEVVCGCCGRAHWPRRRRRTLYPRVTISVPLEGVQDWLEELLGRLESGVQRLPQDGVWRFFHGAEEVYVVLLELAVDTRYTTEAFARAQPVLYVVLDHRRFSRRFVEADWVRVVTLHELAHRGLVALRERLDAPAPGPMLCHEPATRPWMATRSPKTRMSRRVLGMQRMELLDGRALLDRHLVIPPEASAMLEVLRFFAERWREDVRDKEHAGEHCAYSPDEILEDLEEREVASTADPGTVRRQVNRLRRLIARRYVEATGIEVGPDAVVERVEDGGFRLNAQKVSMAR